MSSMTQVDRNTAQAWLRDLKTRGYFTVPGVLDQRFLALLQNKFSEDALTHTSKEGFGHSGGFLHADYQDPDIVMVLTWPKTLDILQAVGFANPKLHSFYISTKPPKAAALPWHSDLFYRYEKEQPAELFLIYYLQDTSRQNGCLRVIPGSHQWPHEKRHKAISENSKQKGVDVPLKAGDLFVGDRRIMHATHPNTSSSWRTCITIAYAPAFDALDQPIQALIVQNDCLPPKGWREGDNLAIDPRLQTILPIYEGTASPISTED